MRSQLKQTPILNFDQFELDVQGFELKRSGRVVKLEKLPMEVLILLAERQGQLVTREEIIQRLWGDDVFVDTRQGINTAIHKIRQALRDDPEHPRILQTVVGRGYRLLLPPAREAPAAAPVEEPSAPEPEPPPTASIPPAPSASHSGGRPWRRVLVITGLALLILVVLIVWREGRRPSVPKESDWTQITHFTGGATSPTLSPDGHMLAFIQGPETFITPGQIYVKVLPDGEPFELTHDDAPKMAPAFSPDGSRIAYTATDSKHGWNTWVVPVLGGEPHELLPNAAAMTWTGGQRVVFSEIYSTDSLMGIFTATESRTGERDVYRPAAWGMAHRSWVSPDGKWVLISEMDGVGWKPCRLIPFDGSTRGETAGPSKGGCTYAGWSPDGTTMYFSADAGDGYHIWRQRFPKAEPEQLTFGAAEEEGVAVTPDGKSLITSAGIRESTVWVHDARGDRQVSGEGFASVTGMGYPDHGGHSVFSPDGRRLYYLVRKQGSREFVSGQLWVADLDTGKNGGSSSGGSDELV